MTQLFESKSLLAKLLAQENLIIEHHKVSTAYFDLKSRTIILPIWKDMDDANLYDLLMGHEVGHALHTPQEGWHSALEENFALKTYLNVCEDARIERKMKDRFPGLRRSFNLAYKKLNEMDFFGLKGLELNKLRLIDRINVFFKMGAHVNVVFTQDELVYIDRISAAETWEEIEVIARELYDRAVDDSKNKPEEESDVDDEELGSFDNLDSGEESESDDFDEDYDEDQTDDSDEDDDSDGEEAEDKNGKIGSGRDYKREEKVAPKEQEQDVSSITDRVSRNNEKNLVDDSNGAVHVINVPTPNRDSYFVSYKKVHDHITEWMANESSKTSYYGNEARSFMQKNSNLYPELLKRVSPVVNYMVKEFEMRKNASQLARAKVGKSGKINPKKLARFNLEQDIFQRITTVPQGKNHGLVMFIDLSGSMAGILQRTFEQAVLLTMFCKKVNIPFEVYGFSNHHNCADYNLKGADTAPFKYSPHDLYIGDPSNFYIKQYLSSTMNGMQYRAAVNNLLYVGASQMSGFTPSREILYGTPLDESILSSIELVSEFKTGYRLDIVNCIFLTDGQGGVNNQFFSSNYKLDYYRSNDTVYLQHKNCKNRVRLKSLVKNNRYTDYFQTTRGLIEIAKQITGAKYTGYLITNKSNIINTVFNYEFNFIDRITSHQQRKSLSKKITEDGYFASNSFGFDEYFFVEPSNLRVTEQVINVDANAKKGAISKAFMKSLNSRGLQRMFLNKFVDNLAA